MRQEIRGFAMAVASAGPYANNLHLSADIKVLLNFSSLSTAKSAKHDI